MVKKLIFVLFACCLLLPWAATAEEPAEWTVLYYFCGADLESRHGYASEDIMEIMCCEYPYSLLWLYEDKYDAGADGDPAMNPIGVNVLLQTGGSKKWDNDQTGLDVRADRLQRWKFFLDPDMMENKISLEQELPLRNMADPATLSDFIRWGVENYPAKKYALVLWGHGDGAKTGIFIDELFNNDVMQLDELRQAMQDGGAFFEAVVLDACLMANIETAVALKDSAAWMVAPEEMVEGHGSATGKWLQDLYYDPGQDGRELGRNICNMTETYYANSDNDQARAILTWSVIDLSKIDRLEETMARFFAMIHVFYQKYPTLLYAFATGMLDAEEYGDGQQNMRDIASIRFNRSIMRSVDPDLRNDLARALSDAVEYCVHGTGRTNARGLSFCYATDFSPEELDVYSHNCTNPYYLAFLDAINTWTAPDCVYEQVERLPEIDTLETYQLAIQKCMISQVVPGIMVNLEDYFGEFNYNLYQLDGKTNMLKHLGRTTCRCYFTENYSSMMWSAVEPWLWPSIDGELCSLKMISATPDQVLYGVPIQVGPDVWYLRYGREYSRFLMETPKPGENHSSQYTVYGLWEGYDDDTTMLGRNVKSLAQMAGQEYQMLYPLEGGTGKTKYATGGMQKLYRAMEIEPMLLPKGTYYLQYEVEDMFMRPILLDMIEMYWDGNELLFPADFTWEGTIGLNWQGQ